MYLGIGLGITRLSGVLGFNPASLFANGEEGAWYDPSDLTTLYQDSKGLTPVTGTGQPVGLMLDKSKGLTLGSEAVTNGTFDTDTDWTKGTGWTISGGVASFVATGSQANLTQSCLTIGKTYKISWDQTSSAGSLVIYVGITAPAGPVSGSGNKSLIVTASGNTTLYIQAQSTFTGTIDNFSIRELPGNHATQSSSTKRPVLQSSGGLYYLDFDGADDWMRTTFGAAQAQPNTIAAALKFDQGSRNEFVVDGVSTDRNAIYKTTTDLQLFAGSSITDPSAAGTTELVTLGHLNTTSSELRVDGSQVVTGDVGSNQWGGITLGADSSDTLWLDGRIYGFVGVNRTLTASEISGVESYLAAKSGVTL